MNFSKLNIEFANMQKSIDKYNKIINSINLKIKENLRIINKVEMKIQKTNNIIEKELSNLYLISIKCENDFLEKLIKEGEINEREKRVTKPV